jgi:tetratricopeptide (TPR) repeat protein
MNESKEKNGRRELLYWLIAMLIIPIFFLGVLEAGLRVAGVGYSTKFTREIKLNGEDFFIENHQFSRLFFPPALAQSPQSFAFPAIKPKQTYRIFILGGSAAEGDPEASYGFGPILKTLLEDRYPGTEFEIVDAAITATNTNVMYQVAKDLVHHQPDMFVIYVGNNEVIGPFGAGTVFAPFFSNLSLIRASIAVRSTRIGQVMQGLIRKLKRGGEIKKWAGMAMFLHRQVRHGDPALANVYDHFRQNLQDTLELGRKASIKTIISTVGVNLKDCAPFASLHKKGLEASAKKSWDKRFTAGKEDQSDKNFSAAIIQYLKAAEIDPDFADLQYRLGQCYGSLGQFKEAKERFAMARELDTLRFRADQEINSIIRSVARGREGEDIFLVDGARALAASSPHDTPGDEMFYEHVHLRFSGNYVLARELFAQVAKNLPDRIKQSADSRPLLTEQECASRLAFTAYDQYRILKFLLDGRFSAPPFTNQSDHEARIEQVKRTMARYEESALAHPGGLVDTYRRALSLRGDIPKTHYNFATLLFRLGNFQEALEQAKIYLRYIPQDYGVHALVADILLRQGKYAEAIAESQKSLDLQPAYHHAAFTLAGALARQGKLDESLKVYEELLKEDPADSVGIYNQKGTILIQQKQFAEAAEAFTGAIRYNEKIKGADNPYIYYNLAFAQKNLGRQQKAASNLDKAIEGYRRLLEHSPNDAAIIFSLGNAWVEKGDLARAALYFDQAVKVRPLDLTYRLSLIKTLEEQGEVDDALTAVNQALPVFQAAGRERDVMQLKKYQAHLNGFDSGH